MLCVLRRCVAVLYVVFMCEPFVGRVARMVALCTRTVCGERAVNGSGPVARGKETDCRHAFLKLLSIQNDLEKFDTCTIVRPR